MPCTGPSTFERTVPRGPVAAMYNSPGPRYSLPGLVGQNQHDPRSVHTKKPAYSFGVRHGKFKDDCSPGPSYFPNPKFYRDGLDGTPHYSLYSRPQDLKSHRTPGPGAYKPENAGESSCYHAPQYSFGSRHRNRRTDNTPGPNTYSLPGMLGKTVQGGKKQAPEYSLRGRSKVGGFAEDLQNTPGPANYNSPDANLYKTRPPGYSISSRNPMPGDSTRKPGPGAHNPEVVWAHKREVPCYSFGIRHSEYVAPLIVDVQD